MVIAHSDLEALQMGMWSLVDGSEHIGRWCFLCDNPLQKHMVDVAVNVDGELDTVPVCDACFDEYLAGAE